MVSGTQRKYYMLGGKGGVGKTSCAASLAVKFANNCHPTLVVSTDPAHSLSDSFAQDLTGGTLVPVEGPISPLFALEVIQFLESQEYNMFTRIVFDTAPTGHTLRLLSLLDFLDASIGKILKLRQKISAATSAIKSVFGQEETQQNAVMAISESSRLCASLRKESVPVKRLVVNQILPPSASDCKFCAMKRKGQTRALGMIQNDPELSSLT
ncbi:UNVERIFIED_CONTAM: ATPase ARSA1 [Sesamum calycinum]|uniref:ATPase ARSA1 n=1 Tax=Sesamum calycinum TaxID=2727403 RepID=A0AAW2KRB5_9LAMI